VLYGSTPNVRNDNLAEFSAVGARTRKMPFGLSKGWWLSNWLSANSVTPSDWRKPF